jgi:hypothetical protein
MREKGSNPLRSGHQICVLEVFSISCSDFASDCLVKSPFIQTTREGEIRARLMNEERGGSNTVALHKHDDFTKCISAPFLFKK